MNTIDTPDHTIILVSDHAGFTLKEELKNMLRDSNLEVRDLGPENAESVNWAEFGAMGARAVAEDPDHRRAILICGSGIGMSIVANKFPGVRGALCHDPEAAAMSRRHNNANVLCLGARVISKDLAVEIVNTWLRTGFDGGRHQTRLDYLRDEVEFRNFR